MHIFQRLQENFLLIRRIFFNSPPIGLFFPRLMLKNRPSSYVREPSIILRLGTIFHITLKNLLLSTLGNRPSSYTKLSPLSISPSTNHLDPRAETRAYYVKLSPSSHFFHISQIFFQKFRSLTLFFIPI